MYYFPLENLKKEFEELNHNPISNFGFSVGLNNNDLRNWKLTLMGPKDSSYARGYFSLTAFFPDGYPLNPPQVCFITPIYHLNVNPNVPTFPGAEPLGNICIQRLGLWDNNCSFKELISNIYSLFYYADPLCGYGDERIYEYRNNRTVYEEKAKFFVRKYANPANLASSDYSSQNWDFRMYN